MTKGAEPLPAERIVRRGVDPYPALLAVLPDAPDLLHVQGDAALLEGPAVAVVGARRASALGLAMGERLGAGLAREGVVVVSGCALGIDAAAHHGALKFSGPTVAVLGGGLDVAAPASNRVLAERIARAGCLVSEYPPGTPALPHHFPARNRIIAGLARIVVVVEATVRSGALITARLALAAGREVMAVPGHPLLPSAAGCNALIADGARAVLTAGDVLEELTDLPALAEGRTPRGAARRYVPAAAGGVSTRLLAALSEAPETAEALAGAIGAPLPAALAGLTELELLGLARACSGSRFARAEDD